VTKEYGIFFLAHMVPERTIPLDDICATDSKELLNSLGAPLNQHITVADVRDDLEMRGASALLPLGPLPTLKDLNRVLHGAPMKVIAPFSMDPEMSRVETVAAADQKSVEAYAVDSFCRFTFCIWITLRDTWKDQETFSPSDFDPNSLEEAMEMWSAKFVSEAIPSLVCEVSRDDTLKGALRGKKGRTFSEIGREVFPSTKMSSKKNSWQVFMERPGYLHFYWLKRQELEKTEGGNEKVTQLEDIIESIFRRLQTLPSMRLGGETWRIKDQSAVTMLVNPRVLLVEGVGKSRDSNRKKARQRTEAAKSVIQTGLLKRYTNNTAREIATAVTAYTQARKRGPKNKNARVPPIRAVVRNRPPSLSSLEDHEEDELGDEEKDSESNEDASDTSHAGSLFSDEDSSDTDHAGSVLSD